jgi:hypothetical protein
MEINNIANAASKMVNTSVDDSIGLVVLKKALDSSSETASALINSIPSVPKPNLPSHLGQNVNITA